MLLNVFYHGMNSNWIIPLPLDLDNTLSIGEIVFYLVTRIRDSMLHKYYSFMPVLEFFLDTNRDVICYNWGVDKSITQYK